MGHPRHGPRPSSSAARLAGGLGARLPSQKQFGAMAFAPYRPYVLAGFRRGEEGFSGEKWDLCGVLGSQVGLVTEERTNTGVL